MITAYPVRGFPRFPESPEKTPEVRGRFLPRRPVMDKSNPGRIGGLLACVALAAVLGQQSALSGAATNTTTTITREPPRSPDDPYLTVKDAPIKWCETLTDGVAEATRRDRPLVVVFPEATVNRHEWFNEGYSQLFVNSSDVVCVRMLPPQIPNIPATATPEQRRLINEAVAKLQKEYNDLVAKYGVTTLPTIVFASPDGDTVLRSYPRTLESTVVNYLRALQSDFENYKKTRVAFHKTLKEKKLPTLLKDDPPAGGGPAAGPEEFGPPIKWHETLAAGLEDAGKSDRPILLVLLAGDRERYEWFYGITARKTINGAGVVPVRLLPPADVYVPRDAKPEVLEAYRKLREQQQKDYTALATKYGVTALPTVLFISPDGEQVFAKHSRVMETTVLDYFKLLPGEFENFKKLRAMIKAGGK
jgi:thioredoxin-related protein